MRRRRGHKTRHGTCGLVAMTSASHAEGRQFDPGQVYAQARAVSNACACGLAVRPNLAATSKCASREGRAGGSAAGGFRCAFASQTALQTRTGKTKWNRLQAYVYRARAISASVSERSACALERTLRPAIAATSAVACSAARVGCELLTVESLRELRGSRSCSLRTSGCQRYELYGVILPNWCDALRAPRGTGGWPVGLHGAAQTAPSQLSA